MGGLANIIIVVRCEPVLRIAGFVDIFSQLDLVLVLGTEISILSSYN